ncbi:tetratricopeptide repeat protein [bacterium]|nr:tetratricopeptide repeat protein [bacterium]
MATARRALTATAQNTLLLAAAAGLLAGCAARVDPGPSIRSIAKQSPDEAFDVRESERVQQNQELAIENYRAILELSADNEKRYEAMRRLADLQLQVGEINPQFEVEQAQSETEFSDSVELYHQLLAERPDDPNNDRVLYQLARAHQNRGEESKSVEVLGRLTEQFPDSRFAKDGVYRRAELLFRMRRFTEAETNYRTVVDYGPDNQFFEQAQYKLGWSVFKQSRYMDAVAAFVPILERELPAGQVPDQREAAIEGVEQRDKELVEDVLRVVSLSFAYIEGGKSLKDFLQSNGPLRFEELLFADLGNRLLEQERYTDAAAAFRAYVDYQPGTLDAPRFQIRSTEALVQGGFTELAIGAKEEFVSLYDFESSFWATRTPQDADVQFVVEALQRDLEEVARHYHAEAQSDETPLQQRASRFERAGNYYLRYTQLFPADEKTPELQYLYAETLYDRGNYQTAADAYTRAAYEYGAHDKAADAGFAAVDASHRYAESLSDGAGRGDALQAAKDQAVRFADNFSDHPEVARVLTRAAEDMYALEQLDAAVQLSERVTQRDGVAPELLRANWQIIGLSRFDQEQFAQAETAFSNSLQLTPAEDAQARFDVGEQLASSIYKQAEAAREAGNLEQAVTDFLRVGSTVPNGSIRPTAEFDAAAALISLEAWPRAVQVLTGFRSRYPGHPLQGEVTRRLATVYLEDDQPIKAAGELSRIANDGTAPASDRQAAALQAAQLYDDNGALEPAAVAYSNYLSSFAPPFDESIELRQRLVEIYTELNKPFEANFWRNELVNANAAAGSGQTDRSRFLAAKAGLVLAERAHREFDRIKLTLPLQASLAQKKIAMEAALDAYNRAAESGVAEIATESTHKVGSIYRQLAKDLMNSQRPSGLSELEREQYDLLLEEQAYPFEERAIDVLESNVARMDQGIYDQWIRASIKALGELSPARYAKQERYEKPVAIIR